MSGLPWGPDDEYRSLALGSRRPPSEREQQLYSAALAFTGVQQRSLPFADRAIRDAADVLLGHRNALVHWFPRLNSEVPSSVSDDGHEFVVPDTLAFARALMHGLSESNGLCAEHETVLFQLFTSMCDPPAACTVSAGATTLRARHVLGLEGLITTRPDIVVGISPTSIEVDSTPMESGPYLQLSTQAHLLHYVSNIPGLLLNPSELPTNPWFPWLFVTVRPATGDPGSAHLANVTDMRMGLETILRLGCRAQRDFNYAEKVTSAVSRVYGVQIVGNSWRIVLMLAESGGCIKYRVAEVWCGSPQLPQSMIEFLGILRRIFAEASERRRLINNWLFCLRHEAYASAGLRSIWGGPQAAHEHQPSKQTLLDSLALRPRRRVPSAPVASVSQRAAEKRRAESSHDRENAPPSGHHRRTISARERDTERRNDGPIEIEPHGGPRSRVNQRLTESSSSDSAPGPYPRPYSPNDRAPRRPAERDLVNQPSMDLTVPGNVDRLDYLTWRTTGEPTNSYIQSIDARAAEQRQRELERVRIPSETRTETPDEVRQLRHQRLQLHNFLSEDSDQSAEDQSAAGPSRPLQILQPRPRRHSSFTPRIPSSAPSSDPWDGYYQTSQIISAQRVLQDSDLHFAPISRRDPRSLENWDGNFPADNAVSVMREGESASSDRPASSNTSSFEGMFFSDPV